MHIEAASIASRHCHPHGDLASTLQCKSALSPVILHFDVNVAAQILCRHVKAMKELIASFVEYCTAVAEREQDLKPLHSCVSATLTFLMHSLFFVLYARGSTGATNRELYPSHNKSAADESLAELQQMKATTVVEQSSSSVAVHYSATHTHTHTAALAS